MPTLDEARAIISAFEKDKRNADNLAKKGRLVFRRPISREVKRNRELCATGLSDILELKDATGLLECPEFRTKLLEVSKQLNSTKARNRR